MLSIRCSSLPLISLCPASAVDDGGPRLAGGGDAADLGTALHACLAEQIRGNHPEMMEIATRYAVDLRELTQLYIWWLHIWRSRIQPWFPDPQVEVALQGGDLARGLHLSGHVDLLSVVGDQIRLCDWKSGRLDMDHVDQLRGYGWLALQAYPQAQGVYACVVRLRDRVLDGHDWTRADLDGWYQDLVAQLVAGGYAPGGHCRFCPRGLSCPAKTALMRQASDALSLDGPGIGVDVPTESTPRGTFLADLLDRIRVVASACERAREVIKADVAAHGGVLPTQDGRELRIVQQTQRRIGFAAGWPILNTVIPAEEHDQCFSVSKGAVEQVVRAGVGRGQKSAAVQELMHRLEEAGAVEEVVIERLEIKRAAAAITHKLQENA